jgi:hypothetical protein
MIQCYVSKVYGPLLDLIDIHIEVPAVQYEEPRGGASAEIRTRVLGPARSSTPLFGSHCVLDNVCFDGVSVDTDKRRDKAVGPTKKVLNRYNAGRRGLW